MTRPPLTIAVPRGALFGGSLDLLEAAGVEVGAARDNDRRLYFEDEGLITTRPTDVPIYVEHGAADLGIVGKDVLMEQFERDVYELLDLDFGRCELVFAAPAAAGEAADELARRLGTVRIATKYPRVTQRYFAATGRQIETIEVKGSVELAAIAGLAEGIVDLTATGATLRENGLEIRERMGVCTARLIANPASYRLKAAAIDSFVADVRAAAVTADGGD